ncbi:Uncharacterized conserved protein [Phaffia rhodozyma]|uniref:Sugar phosphate phosphatase n=1 Tax=Phaffia rhodozyma TaxID=264483 RepID=A0A0F7SWN9_PHARH|nr:Uncharacterized conserved protein [Phaffia rhodozyma]
MLHLGNLPPKPKEEQLLSVVQAQKTNSSLPPRTPSTINPNNPPWPAFRGKLCYLSFQRETSKVQHSRDSRILTHSLSLGYHEFSFAHAVMGQRLPTILSKGMDDTIKTLNEQSDEDLIVDLVACLNRMEQLMSDLSKVALIRPIIDDGTDTALWNKAIARYFQGKDFMSAPWLFAEAYKYRRLRECFSVSKYWTDYDIFFRQKCDTFARSADAVFELSTRFSSPFEYEEGMSEEEKKKARKLLFLELTQVCLWGNSTDLSLLIDMTEEQIKSLQSTGGASLAATEKNILGNDLGKMWNLISKTKNGRIDFVLDNAGFELYTDLVYADWLVQAGIASSVHFHGKRLPWFVSDVTKKDWDWLLNSCVYGQLFPEASQVEMESLRIMGNRWKQYEKEGKWVYEQHAFWTTGYTFWELIKEAPDLFLHLSKSDLVIFKGDLNHRKLTYDCQAPSTTSFENAIGPLSTAAGAPPIVSLRVIKADVVVGLPEGVADRLDKEEPGWRISAKYAVVLLSEGKPGENVVFA